MPVRRTKRGAERTSLEGDWDVIVCGASFAGLTAARELAGSDARVLVVDRYEIGERQTSACGAPTAWLENLGLAASIRQTFTELDFHTPHTDRVMRLPWSFSVFDYPELCRLLWEQSGNAVFETAKVIGLANERPAPGTEPAPDHVFEIETDRGTVRAPLVVDCLGWRRVLGAGGYQPPNGPLSRGLEVHPAGTGDRMELWIERGVVPAGYGWSFPAGDELRVGVGSFDPRFHVKQPTVELAERLDVPPDGYQGNWIPHRIREATESGVFFCGDSAGHCLPLTAEGIRTAFYFAIAAGREIRAVDPDVPIISMQSLRQHRDNSIVLWAVNSGARMFSVFGGVALLLAVIGVYGVKSYVVSRRTREIGIRMALGATPKAVLWLVMREGLVLTLAGTGIGVLLSWGIGKALSGMLYEVSPLDPLVFTVAPLTLMAAALLATFVPARRATHVRPMVALRAD